MSEITIQPSTFINVAKDYDTQPVIVKSGADLKAGTLLHRITAEGADLGKVQKANTAVTSNVEYFGVLGEDVSAATADKASFAITFGELDERKLDFTGTLTFAIRTTLRQLGIRLTQFID